MYKFLVIEDEEDLIPYLEEALSDLAEISVATTLEDAMSIVIGDESSYDLVICDNKLPDGKGLDFVEYFKTKNPRSPVLFMSGSANLNDKLKGFEMDVEDVLEKPMDMRELRQRVRRALKRSRIEAP